MLRRWVKIRVITVRRHASAVYDKLYSPQMVVTANTTKYTIENNLTKKRKKTNTQTNGMYLSKKDQLVI